MQVINVLVAESRPEELALIEGALREEGYRFFRALSAEEILRILGEQEIHILMISNDLPGADVYPLVRRIRGMRKDIPLQIIQLSKETDEREARKSFEAGSDDFIREPMDRQELQARARAAVLRLKNQTNLLKEREFYRIAVAEEERLSSLVLDQNRNLTEAFEKIRRLNEELEKANKDLERLAAFDSLSGLLNRRSLFERISIEIDRSVRLDVPLTGLMIDIDYFKNVNDNYGHQCGDYVIREIGAKLLSGLRKYDYAGRYGGEEFFAVLSNSTEQQAVGISERFRRDLEESSFTCAKESFSLTVSIGIARFHKGETQESWIERTDRAMYAAKQNGRNRIVLA